MHGVAADSGPLVALFNQRDGWHKRVYAWMKINPDARLYTTWPVITEVCALLVSRVSGAAAHDFLTWVSRGGVTLDRPANVSFHDTFAILQRYADVPFDFADASIAELAARLRLTDVLTIDSDFDIYRDARGKALRNTLRSAAK